MVPLVVPFTTTLASGIGVLSDSKVTVPDTFPAKFCAKTIVVMNNSEKKITFFIAQ